MNAKKVNIILSTLPFYSFYNVKDREVVNKNPLITFSFLLIVCKSLIQYKDLILNEPDESKVRQLIPELILKALSKAVCNHNEDAVTNRLIDNHDKILKEIKDATDWSFDIFNNVVELYKSGDNVSLMKIYKFKSILDKMNELFDEYINEKSYEH